MRRGRGWAGSRWRKGAGFFVLAVVTVVALVHALGSNGGGPAPSPTSAAATRTSLPSLSLTVPVAGGPAGAGTTAVTAVTATTATTAPAGGGAVAMPFPAKGEGAVAISGTGVVAASPDERPVPIASMTKMMTAYLVLEAHPLIGGEAGPTLRFTAADHSAWIRYAEHDLSNVELVAGERLDERQLLEALLIPSADNVADLFARWVGGTKARFVALMNETARKLGMDHTTYADASGVSSHTVSTAADQALLATIVMRNPVVRSIVRQQDVPFPVEGHVWNYNPVLGVDGIVGVKSGFTGAAGGCLTTAAWRTIGGRSVLVVSVVTGQPLGLGEAGQADVALLKAETADAKRLSPFGTGTVVATVRAPWSHRTVEASIPAPFEPVAPPGLTFSASLVGAPVTARQLREGWGAGTVVGTLRVTSPFGTVAVLPVSLDRAIAPPPKPSGGSLLPKLPARFPVRTSSRP